MLALNVPKHPLHELEWAGAISYPSSPFPDDELAACLWVPFALVTVRSVAEGPATPLKVKGLDFNLISNHLIARLPRSSSLLLFDSNILSSLFCKLLTVCGKSLQVNIWNAAKKNNTVLFIWCKKQGLELRSFIIIGWLMKGFNYKGKESWQRVDAQSLENCLGASFAQCLTSGGFSSCVHEKGITKELVDVDPQRGCKMSRGCCRVRAWDPKVKTMHLNDLINEGNTAKLCCTHLKYVLR